MKVLVWLGLIAGAGCTAVSTPSGELPPGQVDNIAVECDAATANSGDPAAVEDMARKTRKKDCADTGRIAGSDWRVSSINYRGAQHSRLSFTKDRLTGRSCNQFSTSYRIVGTSLVPGEIIATRMICDPVVMEEERRLFAALKGPLKMRFGDTGALALTAADGRSITLDRVT